MLSRRVARASTLRSATSAIAACRLPIIQQRTFLPRYNDKVDEKYPDSDYPSLTDAEDPNMVRGSLSAGGGTRLGGAGLRRTGNPG